MQTFHEIVKAVKLENLPPEHTAFLVTLRLNNIIAAKQHFLNALNQPM